MINLSTSVQEIYQLFLNCKELLDIQTYRDVEADMRKLKEKFQFCTPFGRLNGEVAELEEEIQNQIISLDKLLAETSSTQKEELAEIIERIKYLTATTLQAMERREKLLIR